MQALVPAARVLINSAYRTSGTSSQPTFIMQGSLFTPSTDPEIDRFVAVNKAVIPLTMQVVQSSNNQLSITETNLNTGIPQTFTVTIGNGSYDLFSFELAVQQALNNASAILGYTLTYFTTISTTTGNMTFGITDADYEVYLNFGSPTTANTILGLPSSGQSTAITDSQNYTGTGIVSISGPRMLVIRSPNFVSSFYEARTNSLSNIIGIIPVTAPPFYTQIWEEGAFPKMRGRIASQVDNLIINITDENGIQLDFQGETIQIDFAIYEIRRI